MKKTLFACMVILICIINLPIQADASNENDEKDHTKVLIFHSYHKGLNWTDELQRGIEEELKSDDIELMVQYMDSYRFNHEGYYEDIFNYYFQKYKNEKIDVVIVADNFAYDFMKIYYNQLFKDVPIVFVGINNFSRNDLINQNTTGIAQTSSQSEMIGLILKLHKNIDTIIISGNVNPTAVAEVNAIIKIGDEEYPDIKFIPILTNTFEELIEEVKKDRENSAIIAVGTIKNQKGNFLDHSEFSSKLIDETGLPVYAMAKCYIVDEGAIGGIAVDSYIHGKIVGDYTKKIINGTTLLELPIIETPLADPIFDYNRIKQFKIDKKYLPKGTIILNNPSKILIVDKKYVYLVMLIIAIMGFLIIGFLINSLRRKKAEKILMSTKMQLLENNIELESKNMHLSHSREQLNIQYAELEEKNAKIEFLAYYDPLTKLMKRETLLQVLTNKINKEKVQNLGIYDLDISNLKTINDTYGYHIGNKILQIVAQKLETMLKEKKSYVGIHQSEFIILDFDINSISHALINAEGILNGIIKTIYVGNLEIDLEINIGIAIYPDHGKNANTLFKNANIALMESIKNGKNNQCIYHEVFYKSIVNRLELEKQLKKAIYYKEFELFYQPKVDTNKCDVLGVEALIRWHHPNGNVVYPGQFIEIAEETGFINSLGEWVIFEACKQIKEWEKMGIKLNVSVNVSAKQLMGSSLLNIVDSAIRSNHIDANLLELEITETAVMHDIKHNAHLIQELRKLGVGIALDDFGTGYSSMNYIKELSITKIKIDKTFIDHIHIKAQKEIVKSIIVLGQALNFIINIEGVERIEQFKILQEYYANEVQGFLFSKALPKHEIPAFIHEFKHKFEYLYKQ